jgi:hypothetical protein
VDEGGHVHCSTISCDWGDQAASWLALLQVNSSICTITYLTYTTTSAMIDTMCNSLKRRARSQPPWQPARDPGVVPSMIFGLMAWLFVSRQLLADFRDDATPTAEPWRHTCSHSSSSFLVHRLLSCDKLAAVMRLGSLTLAAPGLDETRT